jgi:hypothetical protein
LLNVTVAPWHRVVVPRIAVLALIVTVVVALQPVVSRYVIVVVPAVRPDTIPVVDPTLAFVGELLLQVPPGVRSLSVVVKPTHTVAGVPRIGVIGLTCTVSVLKQPVEAII